RAVEVTLYLHEDVGATEDGHQPVEDSPRGVAVTRPHGVRERPARAAGEADETARRGYEILEADGGLALGRAELGPRDQPAEILPALAILDEHRQPRAVGECELAAHEWSDTRVDRGAMEARRAVDAVTVDERQRRHVTPRGLGHQRLRLIRALEKRERRLRVQLHKHHSAPAAVCPLPQPPCGRVSICTLTGATSGRFAWSNGGGPIAPLATRAPLVIDAIEIPLPRTEVAREPADGAVGERHVPLVARPRPGVPPFARHAPRAGASDDAHLGSKCAVDQRRSALAVRGDPHPTRRAQPAQRQHG